MTEAALLSSGVPAIDARWGGLAPGAAYALVGPPEGGRLALALYAARAAVDGAARVLLVSPRPTDELVAAARTVGLDLAAAHTEGRLRLLRIPDAAALAARGDDGLARALTDLARLVETDRPDRVIVDDLAPLAAFSSADAFADAFGRFADALRALDASLLVGLAPPQDASANGVLAAVQARAAGTIEIAGDGAERRLVLHGGTDAAPAPTPAPPDPADDPADASAFAADPLPEPDAPALAYTGDGIPMTPISEPPPADPTLAHDAGDPFGLDAHEFLSQGFLVDSGAGAVVGHVPAPPASAPQPAPEWAPLAMPEAAPTGRASFTAGLDAAYATGARFDAVAIRMEPGTPAAAHFATLVGGLQAALTPDDDLYADHARCRAVVRLAGADRAGALFGAVQAFVRRCLGAEAEGVLAGIAAAPIAGGAPFTSGEALMAYAIDQ